jgi:glycerophosphoryl diester phosphodiesterase
MSELYDQSVRLILWLQQGSPAWDGFFLFLSSLGGENFYLLLFPAIYWSFDRRLGARLAVLFLLTIWLNSLIKLLAGQPRPFQYDSRVQPLDEIETGGFPSAHTQNTTVIWLYLALRYRQGWLWALALLLLILVPLSRLYLGLHFVTDLLGGFVLGLASLALFGWVQPPFERWLGQQSLAIQLGVGVVPALILPLLLPGNDENAIAATGTLLGLGVGLALERRFVRFAVAAGWGRRLLCFITGFLVLLVIYVGLRLLIGELTPEPVWRYVRYVPIGLWVTYGAPWLFVRLKLAAGEASAPAPRPNEPALDAVEL